MVNFREKVIAITTRRADLFLSLPKDMLRRTCFPTFHSQKHGGTQRYGVMCLENQRRQIVDGYMNMPVLFFSAFNFLVFWKVLYSTQFRIWIYHFSCSLASDPRKRENLGTQLPRDTSQWLAVTF